MNLTDAELAADGLMPRNAFANIADWDRSVLHAGVRVCDTFQVFNTADGSPAIVNGAPSASAPHAGPWSPRQPKDGGSGTDCNCVNYDGSPGYAGFADDGSWTSTSNGPTSTQHVAQYAYSWVPTLAPNGQGNDPISATDSIWVGSSGLFTLNNSHEVLQQTGIEDWFFTPLGNPGFQLQDELFWECIDPSTNNAPPCNAPQEWDGTQLPSPDPVRPGDEITMYISGNYHWNEDDRSGMINSGNIGPQPILDSSEWITEDPDCSPNCGVQPLANYGHTGVADMKWMDEYNNWRDASDDTDYIMYAAKNPSSGRYTEQVGGTFPYYIDSTWNWGMSVWWQHTN